MTDRFLVLELARRLARGRRLRYSSLTIGVTTAFLVASYMTLQALSLTAEQRVEQELGRFASSIDLGGIHSDIKPAERTPLDRLAAAAKRAGLSDIDVELHSVDVQTAAPGAPAVFYTEREWTARPLPARYRLLRGRWPVRPGEVAITNPEKLGVASLGELKLFSRRDSFAIVGFAADRYGVFPQLLAAPGSWATLDARVRDAFPTALATLRLYSTTADTERMARLALGTVRQRSGGTVSEVAQHVETPATLAASAEPVWFARLPSAYRVPAALLPLLAMLLMIAMNDRWLRRRLRSLTDAGVPRRHAASALLGAVLAGATVAAVGGAAVGAVLALAGRPLLSAAHPLPLSPPVVPLAPIVNVFVILLAGWLAAVVAVRFGRFERRERTAGLGVRSRRWRDARRLATLAAACGAVALTAELRTAAQTMVVAGCVAVAAILLAPDVVGWTAARLREPGPVAVLAKRQLAADSTRATLVVAVTAVSLGLPLGFLTLLDTTLATERSERVPEVGERQLYVSGVGGLLTPPRPGLRRVVARTLGPEASGVPLGYLAGAGGASLVTAPHLDGTFILTVDEVDGAASLLARSLTSAEATALRDGGMLAWDARPGAQRLVITDGPDVVKTLDVRAQPVSAPRLGWVEGTQGVMLASTARRLGLPHSLGATFYSGLEPDRIAQARRAVVSAGFDREQVTVFAPPPPVVPRAAQAAAAIGLALLVICIGLAVARAQVAAVSRYLGALLAIGIPPAWPRHVLLVQQAVTLGLGTALALLIALPPVVAAAWRVPDVVLSVPWTSLAAVIVTVYGSAALVTVLAARSLRAYGR